jgi:hypothetical protein
VILLVVGAAVALAFAFAILVIEDRLGRHPTAESFFVGTLAFGSIGVICGALFEWLA